MTMDVTLAGRTSRRRVLQMLGTGMTAPSMFGASALAQGTGQTRWGMSAEQAAEWAKIEAAANKEGEITYYGQGLLSQTQIPLLQKAFNADYPQIKLNILNVGSGQQVVSRVMTEQDSRQFTGDLFDTSVRQGLQSMDPSGYTQPFVPPAGQDRSVEWSLAPSPNPGKSGVTVFRDQLHCNFINTNLVKPEDEPKTYADFINPKYKGGIVWNTPWSSGSGWLAFYYARRTYGDEWVRKMAEQQVTFAAVNADAMIQLARGEHRIALAVNSSVTTTALFRSNAPIKAVWPTDMTFRVPGAVIFLKGAPHPNATKVLINWFLTLNGQKFWASVGQWPIRKDVVAAEPWMQGGPASAIIHDTTELTEEMQAEAIKESSRIFRRR